MLNKKIMLSLAVAMAVSTTTVSAKTVEERLQELESIISAMKKNKIETDKKVKELESTIASMKESKADNEEVIDELDERVSDVEFRSYQDKVFMGVGLRVENNNYSNTRSDGSKFDSTISRVKANLNLKSKISDTLKFVGRLSMYKNWGDQTPRGLYNDYAQGRRPNGSDIYFERAYADWIMTPKSTVPLTLSLGRLSTTDGPSYNIKEDTKRKGTFDALAYDWTVDGAILTANLDKVVEGLDVQFTYFTPSVEDEPRTIAQIGYEGTEDTKVTGLIVNKTFKNLSFGNTFQAYYIPATDTQAITQDSTGTTHRDNLGDMIISGAMFEATKIGGKVDFFAHYAQNTAKPNGQTLTMATGDANHPDAYLGLLQTSATENGASKDDLTGHAIWIGARYHINKEWKIGAEYNKGSKNWFSFTVGSNDPTNKLAVRGNATEIYISKSINKYANFRLGYVDINLDYTNSGMLIGTPYDIDSPQAKAMGAIKESQNIYLTFNLLF